MQGFCQPELHYFSPCLLVRIPPRHCVYRYSEKKGARRNLKKRYKSVFTSQLVTRNSQPSPPGSKKLAKDLGKITLLPFFSVSFFACSLFDAYIDLYIRVNALCFDEIHISRPSGLHLPLLSNGYRLDRELF